MAPEKRRRKRPKSDDNDDDDDYNEKIKAHDNDEGGQKQEDHEKEEEEEPPIRRSSRSRLAKTRRLLVDDQEDEDEQEELDNQRRENVEEMEGDDFHPIETDEEGGEDGMEKEDDYDEDHDKEKKKKSQSTKSGKKATTKKTKKKSDKVERRCPHCSKIFQHLKGLSYHVDNYVCRSEERPGGSAMKGKRKEHPEGSEGGASRKKYKRLRGKEKDRTCSRCNRVFTSVLGLTYHLEKRVCVKAVVKELPFPTLEPGTLALSAFGVVKVIRDDRATPTVTYPDADTLKKLTRQYNAFKQKREIQIQKTRFNIQALHLLQRKRLNRLYTKGTISQESVFSTCYRRDPRDRLQHTERTKSPRSSWPDRPDPNVPQGSFPDRIVECILVPDERSKYVGVACTKVEQSGSSGVQGFQRPVLLFLRRQTLTALYDPKEGEIFACQTCGQGFESRMGMIHHIKNQSCVRKAAELKTKMEERLDMIETRAQRYLTKGGPQRPQSTGGDDNNNNAVDESGAASEHGTEQQKRMAMTRKEAKKIVKADEKFVDPRITLEILRKEFKLMQSQMIGPMYPEVFKRLKFKKATVAKTKTKKKKKKIPPFAASKTAGKIQPGPKPSPPLAEKQEEKEQLVVSNTQSENPVPDSSAAPPIKDAVSAEMADQQYVNPSKSESTSLHADETANLKAPSSNPFTRLNMPSSNNLQSPATNAPSLYLFVNEDANTNDLTSPLTMIPTHHLKVNDETTPKNLTSTSREPPTQLQTHSEIRPNAPPTHLKSEEDVTPNTILSPSTNLLTDMNMDEQNMPPEVNESDDYARSAELPTIVDMRVLVSEVNSGRYPSLKRYKEGVKRALVCAVCRQGSKSAPLIQCGFCTQSVHFECMLGRYTVKVPEPDDAFMCHTCVSVVMARRNRAEKRRLEKLGIINPVAVLQRQKEVVKERKELVEGNEYECVLEQGRQAADLVEMLREAKIRLEQAGHTAKASEARRAAIRNPF